MKSKPTLVWERRYGVSLMGRDASYASSTQPDTPIRWQCDSRASQRRHAAQYRPGGVFFFLNVAPGPCSLSGLDVEGKTVFSKDLVVPAPTPGSRLQILSVDVETAVAAAPKRSRRTVK